MSRLQRTVGFYFVNKSTAGGSTADDTVLTHPAQPPAKTGTLRVRRMWPFGIRSVVPPRVEAITVGPMASEAQKVMIAAESDTYGPDDLAEGEVAIYSSAHKEGAVCYVKLDKNGQIAIRAKNAQKITIDAGTGADVVVNGGTKEVARKGDLCKINSPSFLLTWMGQVETYINTLAPGTIAPLAATFAVAPGIVVDQGAEHFKA